MHTDLFEKAFDNFIAQQEYDRAEQVIFDLAGAAFAAGWRAAMQEAPIKILPMETTPKAPARNNLLRRRRDIAPAMSACRHFFDICTMSSRWSKCDEGS